MVLIPPYVAEELPRVQPIAILDETRDILVDYESQEAIP